MPVRRLSCALLAAMAALATALAVQAKVAAQDYNKQGPYGGKIAVFKQKMDLPLPSEGMPAGAASSYSVELLVTYPSGSPASAAPFPLLFMFNGFQAKAPYYSGTVQHAVSWGYVVVQYTHNGLLPIVPDRIELSFVDALLTWLRNGPAASGGPLQGAIDWTRMATMGHSRGGKIAALHFAGRADIGAAVLIDPVDGSSFTPESEDYPSAVSLLKASGKTAAVIGAGISGSCNPVDYNYQKFYSAAGAGSWQMVVKAAGHMQFLRTGNSVMDFAFNRLCGAGKTTAQKVIGIVAPTAVAWLQQAFRPEQAVVDLPLFKQWLQGEVKANTITFDEKQSPPVDR